MVLVNEDNGRMVCVKGNIKYKTWLPQIILYQIPGLSRTFTRHFLEIPGLFEVPEYAKRKTLFCQQVI